MAGTATGNSEDFEQRLESLDIELFRAIPSQTSPEDKRSLLALQLACRRRRKSFRWLEIGSHLGGSLQALIRDPACEALVSIDLRPRRLPDERISSVTYPDNSTDRMLALLRALPNADLTKLNTHDADTRDLNPYSFESPDVCFIDAEHTDEACARDAKFCRQVLRDEGVIAFHDVGIVYGGISAFLDSLAASRISSRVAYLPDALFTVELGDSDLLGDPAVTERRLAAGSGVLRLLRGNDRYRAVLKGRRARVLRRLGLLRIDDSFPPDPPSPPGSTSSETG